MKSWKTPNLVIKGHFVWRKKVDEIHTCLYESYNKYEVEGCNPPSI